MNGLLLGETLSHEANASTRYEGHWMPAGGNEGVAGVEVFAVSATNAFTVHLETKSSDEVDTDAVSIGNVGITSTTSKIWKFDVSNAKDLVRYVLLGSKASDESVHLQFCQTMWAPD